MSVDAVKDWGAFTAVFQEDLVKKGKTIGWVKGALRIANLPFIHQMITGVSTEKKIEMQTLPVVISDTKYRRKSSLSSEICEFVVSTNKLRSCVQRIAEKEQISGTDMNLNELREHLAAIQEVRNVLIKTQSNSVNSFSYQDVNELLSAQEEMLRLGEHLSDHCEKIDYNIRPHYYQCLSDLLKRAELDLGSLSLNVHNKGLFKVKTAIGMKFISLLNRLLCVSLPKLKIRGADPRIYTFVEYFLAIAYFRIPNVKEIILRAIQKKMWEELSCFKYFEESEETNIEYAPMLDWNSSFYSYLPELNRQREVMKLLNDEKWQKIMSKRGSGYFKFVEEWTLNVHSRFVSVNIP